MAGKTCRSNSAPSSQPHRPTPVHTAKGERSTSHLHTGGIQGAYRGHTGGIQGAYRGYIGGKAPAWEGIGRRKRGTRTPGGPIWPPEPGKILVATDSQLP